MGRGAGTGEILVRYAPDVAYAIQRDESLPDAIRRIMDEQIVRAREQITDQGAPLEKRVHDTRKRYKETRALIRLVRDPLGPQYPIENAWFRDAGRDLAAARDADAVLEALDKLELSPRVRNRVRKQLAVPLQTDLEGHVAKVLEQLIVAQARFATWPDMSDSFDTLAAGLRRTYRAGRRAMRDAQTAEELHEWRKAVKSHWYHAQLLRQIWPEMMKAYAAVLEELSHALGDHHDLAVLRERVAKPSPSLNRAIETRQRELERRAQEIGRRVYAESPRQWSARMRKVWDAWRTA